MRNEKRPVVAFYYRLATDEQAEEKRRQKQLATVQLQQFLKEQEVQPCRRYRLFIR